MRDAAIGADHVLDGLHALSARHQHVDQAHPVQFVAAVDIAREHQLLRLVRRRCACTGTSTRPCRGTGRTAPPAGPCRRLPRRRWCGSSVPLRSRRPVRRPAPARCCARRRPGRCGRHARRARTGARRSSRACRSCRRIASQKYSRSPPRLKASQSEASTTCCRALPSWLRIRRMRSPSVHWYWMISLTRFGLKQARPGWSARSACM